MPKKDKCLIAMVLDRSGSMHAVRDDAVGGFNRFMEEQKQVPGEAEVYLAQFDHDYDVIFENMPIADVPALDDQTYQPRGVTALLDAVGRTIDDIGRILDGQPEDTKPAKVMLVVLTDGHENASQNYTNEKVKGMIEHQKSKYGWQVTFLGAGVDAWAIGGDMGIDKNMCFNVARTGQGIQAAYTTASISTKAYRTGGRPDWEKMHGSKEGAPDA